MMVMEGIQKRSQKREVLRGKTGTTSKNKKKSKVKNLHSIRQKSIGSNSMSRRNQLGSLVEPNAQILFDFDSNLIQKLGASRRTAYRISSVTANQPLIGRRILHGRPTDDQQQRTHLRFRTPSGR